MSYDTAQTRLPQIRAMSRSRRILAVYESSQSHACHVEEVAPPNGGRIIRITTAHWAGHAGLAMITAHLAFDRHVVSTR